MVSFPTQRRLATAAAVVCLASAGLAQNLLNPDFEASWASTPANWLLAFGPSTYTRDTSVIHTGNASCRVDVSGTWAEFGKHWTFPANGQPTQPLKARVRLKVSNAPVGARIRVAAEAFDQSLIQWNLAWLDANGLPGSTWTNADPASPYWQELDVSYVPANPTGSSGATTVRLWVVASNASGASVHVDSVDFAGSSTTTYGGLESTIAKQVTSTRLSLVYDALTKKIPEVRDVSSPNPGRRAVGPNLVHTPEPLYTAYWRNTISSVEFPEDAPNHILNVSTLNVPGRTGWRVTKTGPGTTGVGVEVDIYSENGGSAICFEPRVTRPSLGILEGFKCPQFKFAVDHDATPNDSFAVSPRGGGAIVPLDPAAFADLGTGSLSWKDEYPGAAALQLLAFYDADFGVGLMANDETGENKYLELVVDGPSRRCDLSIRHRLSSLPFGAPNSSVATFVRSLVPCRETWQEAADAYRDWARSTELWARAQDRQTADWLLERPTLFEADLRPQGIGQEIVPLGQWTSLMNSWRTHLGTSMVPLYRSFEKDGVFIGPDYLPLNVLDDADPPATGGYPVLHNEAAILSSWTSVAGAAHWPMAMVAGLNWAANHPSTGAPSRAGTRPAYDTPTNTCTLPTWPNPVTSTSWWTHKFSSTASGSPWSGIVVKARPPTSGPQVDLYEGPWGPAFVWSYGKYFMDPRDPFTINTHYDLAKKMASGGLRLYLFDQMNGGFVPDNFDPVRPTPGAGAWKAQGIRGLFASTRAVGKAKSPDFELAIEDPCEQAIDLVAVQGFRASTVRSGPAVNIGSSATVPLFPSVFNEVVSIINWDERYPSQWWSTNHPTWQLTGDPASVATRDEHRQHQLVNIARDLVAGAWLAIGPQDWMWVEEYRNAYLPNGCSHTPTGLMLPLPATFEQTILSFFAACVRTGSGPAAPFLHNGRMVRMTGFAAPGTITTYRANEGVAPYVPIQRIQHCALETSSGDVALLMANADLSVTEWVALPSAIGSHTVLTGDTFQVYVDGTYLITLAYTPGMIVPIPPKCVVLLDY